MSKPVVVVIKDINVILQPREKWSWSAEHAEKMEKAKLALLKSSHEVFMESFARSSSAAKDRVS
jgi:hypothetical protein